MHFDIETVSVSAFCLHTGDLFDMLLPMLGIYQEYVRNHHYSLQVLAECKQKPEYNQLLHRYEEKSQCEGRTLEAFLTYPMHQVGITKHIPSGIKPSRHYLIIITSTRIRAEIWCLLVVEVWRYGHIMGLLSLPMLSR